MARTQYPTMINFDGTHSFEIDEQHFEIDFFQKITKYVPLEIRNQATDTLKEIIKNSLITKYILEKQKVGQSTTPASVNKRLYELLNALRPFVKESYGIDQDTFDKLNGYAKLLFEEANKQYQINLNLKLNAGIDYEQGYSLQPYLLSFFKLFTPSIPDVDRDDWVCSIFEHIGIKYHTPENGLASFRARYITGQLEPE